MIQLLLLLLIAPVMPSLTPSGNFYFASQQELIYYPGSQFECTLTNLSVGYEYDLLIGADQNSYDYQWLNFTASKNEQTIKFIHFDQQSMLDNTSTELTRLLLELYYSDTKLDSVYLTLRPYSSQLNPWFLGGITVTILEAAFFLGFLIIIIRRFMNT